ncbi:MAG: transmembrane(s)proteins 13..35 [Parcubacteria bacterium 33_209]|nr:MAG: transmembrane(s)proteins 13..35 [Parcubacteria bacterium 33_209]
MIKKIITILFVSLFVFADKALAVCPVCTVAVASGVGASRSVGVDDLIIGLWVGALIVSMIMWTVDWLNKKNFKFKGLGILTAIGYFALVVLPLYTMDIIGNPLNSFCGCGIDKLLVGIIGGSIAFWFGAVWYEYLKERNNNKAYFPFQKVVMPILPVIILSIMFYFLTK